MLDTAQKPIDCEGAKNLFTELGDYSDCVQKIEECRQKALQFQYDAAVAAMERASENKNSLESTFRNIQKMFLDLGDYADSMQRAEECSKEAEKKKEEEEYNKKLNMYNQAVRLMDSGTRMDLAEASSKFRVLGEFKDSAELNRICLDKIQEIEAREEQTRQEWAEKSKKAEIKKKRIIIISLISAAVIATSAILTFTVIVPNVKYSKANTLLESRNFDEAASIYSELEGFKDSDDMIKECSYQKALTLMESSDYDSAKAILSNLSDYKDAANQIKNIDHEMDFLDAIKLYESKDFNKALHAFRTLKNMEYRVDESSNYLEKVYKEYYDEGMKYLDSKEYDKAIGVFNDISEYLDSKVKLSEAKTMKVLSFAQKGDFCSVYEQCKGMSISFQEFMEENGYADVFAKYHEDFLKYAGRYYSLSDSGEKSTDHYIDVKVNESNWSFSMSDTFYGDLTYEHGTFYYQFNKSPKFSEYADYDSISDGIYYMFETNNNRILYQVGTVKDYYGK